MICHQMKWWAEWNPKISLLWTKNYSTHLEAAWGRNRYHFIAYCIKVALWPGYNSISIYRGNYLNKNKLSEQIGWQSEKEWQTFLLLYSWNICMYATHFRRDRVESVTLGDSLKACNGSWVSIILLRGRISATVRGRISLRILKYSSLSSC